jgi:DNA-binding SARP family transcriptional activator
MRWRRAPADGAGSVRNHTIQLPELPTIGKQPARLNVRGLRTRREPLNFPEHRPPQMDAAPASPYARSPRFTRAGMMSKRQSASGAAKIGGEAQVRLEIALFGRLALKINGQDVAVTGRKARALIGYLAMSERLAESRERIVGLLWSGSDEGHARGSLRQTLAELRRVFKAAGFDGLHSDKLSIGFEPPSVSVDLADLLAAVKAGGTHPILAERQRAADTLLEEFETVDDGFRDWLRAKRQSITNGLTRVLEERMRRGDASLGEQRDAAQALLNLEPSNEEAARVLITAAIDSGNVGGAFAIYESLWNHLSDVYEERPSEETQSLIAAIRQRPEAGDDASHVQPLVPALVRSPAPSAARIAPRAGARLVVSIAPFDISRATEESHYRVQGFRRELMASLVRFREWLVCDRALVLDDPEQSSAREAEYVIEANALEAGGEQRLVLMLREAGSDAYLWSERLKLSLETWFEAQEFIVRRLATALNVHLSAERMSAIADRAPADLKAYDMWLLAQATLSRFQASSWEHARQILQAIIGQSPGFAPAYSSLAQLNNSAHIALPGVLRNQQLTDVALGFAREAARLDPIDSRSQLCLGWSHAMSKQYEQATIHMSLAHELNENDAWTLVSSANCLAFCAEYAKASEIAARVLQLPMAPSAMQWSYQTAIRFIVGDYAGCVDAAAAAGDHINPNVPAWRTAALYHLGDVKAAAAELEKFYELTRRRWTGQVPASEEMITRWLLQMFPIRRKDDWARLRDGLAGAGAPVGNMAHHAW